MNTLTFVGAGSMAESILTGILNSELLPSERIAVTNRSDKERLAFLKQKYAVQQMDDSLESVKGADIVVLAVKPHDLESSLTAIKDGLTSSQLLISVIAGVSTETISEYLEGEIPVVRAMPNTSAAAGESATAVAGGKFSNRDHLNTATALFNTIGTATEVEEDDMHTVTAISGSGPAYVYYIVEAMEQAAVEAGLDQSTAHDLIVQTIAGAGEMLQTSDLTPSELRKNITSSGGTTQAGLDTLDARHVREAVMACVNQARQRSIELGKGS